MPFNSRLLELSKQITDNTQVVNEYLESHNIKLTFDIDGTEAFPTDAPPEILEARRLIREATKELYDLTTGPAEHLRWFATRYHDISSLRWISHFKLAQNVPISGSISYAELSQKAGVDELQCKRVIRHAMTNNIFQEPKAGYVAHTAGSALLARNRGLRDWVGYTTEEMFPCSAKLVEATEGKDGKNAYQLAFDTDLIYFEHLAAFPERAQRFANTMNELMSTDGYNIRHLLNGFKWDELDAGSTVVDVGGSTGHASIAIAEQNPSLKFIVLDRPEVIQQGQAALAKHPALKDRITFEAHDFFNPQQPRNASVYLLRCILHDHADPSSSQILKNIVAAMRPRDRILVMDGITPEPNSIPKSEERIIRILDMQMMTSFNSGERELYQWEALFAAADPRLKLKNVVKPTGSVSSVMELVLED